VDIVAAKQEMVYSKWSYSVQMAKLYWYNANSEIGYI